MAWQDQAKKMSAGKWLKFDQDNPEYTVVFIGEPTVVEKVSTIKGKEGEVYTAMSFPVEVDGDEKLLEPNRSLLTQILAEDKEESIMGRTIKIICLNTKTKKDWKLRSVSPQATVNRNYADPAKEIVRQMAAEPEAIPEKEAQDKAEREKFHKEVQKRSRKLVKDGKPVPKEEQSIEPIREPAEAE